MMEEASTYIKGTSIIQLRHSGDRIRERMVSRFYFEIYVIIQNIFRKKRILRVYRDKYRIIELNFDDIELPFYSTKNNKEEKDERL